MEVTFIIVQSPKTSLTSERLLLLRVIVHSFELCTAIYGSRLDNPFGRQKENGEPGRNPFRRICKENAQRERCPQSQTGDPEAMLLKHHSARLLPELLYGKINEHYSDHSLIAVDKGGGNRFLTNNTN